MFLTIKQYPNIFNKHANSNLHKPSLAPKLMHASQLSRIGICQDIDYSHQRWLLFTTIAMYPRIPLSPPIRFAPFVADIGDYILTLENHRHAE